MNTKHWFQLVDSLKFGLQEGLVYHKQAVETTFSLLWTFSHI